MRWRPVFAFVVVGVLAALVGGPAMAQPSGDTSTSRTFVFRLRIAGQIASGVWTSCPRLEAGAVCTETTVLAFNTKDREGRQKSRSSVVRVLTFVFRVVAGEDGLTTVPVAEWFGRTESADVRGTPRLARTTATATVPVQICTVFDPTSGVSCPETLRVNVVWTGIGSIERLADHTVVHMSFRLENSWTRGWRRDATAVGTVNGHSPGVFSAAEMLRVDQGAVIVQHPLPATR